MKIRSILPAKSEALHCSALRTNQSGSISTQTHTVEVFQALSLGTEGVDVVDIDENSAMDNSCSLSRLASSISRPQQSPKQI
jgi:hypothetical protein